MTKNMRTAAAFLILLAMFSQNSISQTNVERSGFLSASVGTFWMQSDKFQEVTGSKMLPHFGAGFGVALSKQKYVYARFAYHTRKGTIEYFDVSGFPGSSRTRYKDVTYEQITIDAGFGSVTTTTQAFGFGLLVGVAYVRIAEDVLSLGSTSVDAYGPKASFFIEFPFEGIGSSISLEGGALFTLATDEYPANAFGGYDASVVYRLYFGG